MVGLDDIVITGLGCVSPIGCGRQALTTSLMASESAVHLCAALDNSEKTAYYGAKVPDFDGKLYVKPRKALKVMSREVQMAYAAAQLAWEDAQLTESNTDPDRIGVVFGSEIIPGDATELQAAVQACASAGELDTSQWGRVFEKEIYPLWMLRNLPNMPACHVGIAVDARGPNNTIAHEEVSGLLALLEAVVIMERDQADMMVVGGIGNRVSPTRLSYRPGGFYDQHPRLDDDSPHRCLPFTEHARGIVAAEGAGAIILEKRRHAVARGATILAKFCGGASRFSAPEQFYAGSAQAIQDAIVATLGEYSAKSLDHINAQAFSDPALDANESRGIHAAVGGEVPVTAFSNRMGTAGAGCGIIELIVSLIGMQQRLRFGMLNHPGASPEHSISLAVADQPTESDMFLKNSFTPFGHAAAVLIQSEA